MSMALKAITDLEDYNKGHYTLWSFPSLLAGTESQDDLKENIEKYQGALRTKALAYLHIQQAALSARKISQTPELENLAIALAGRLQ